MNIFVGMLIIGVSCWLVYILFMMAYAAVTAACLLVGAGFRKLRGVARG